MIRARLLLRLSLASVWLLTALASLIYPRSASLALLSPLGLTGASANTALYTGIALDFVMGILTLLNPGRWQRWLWPLQAGIILVYSAIIAVFLPDLALHPFGILIKNIPLLAILWILWREDTDTEGARHV